MAILKRTSLGLLLLATPALAGSSGAGAVRQQATHSRNTAQADNPREVAAQAGAATSAKGGDWSPSSGVRGTLGVHRVEAAHPLAPGELVLTLAGSYSTTGGFLVAGDNNKRQRQQVAIVWAVPWVKEVVKPAPTWRVEGTVMDKASGEPVPGATVAVSGTGDSTSASATDPKTGKFRSYALPIGEGILKLEIEAPGYLASESTMPKGAADEVKAVAVVLQRLGKDLEGEIKGSLEHSRSGKTVMGQVFIPTLGKKIKATKEGAFSAEVKSGRYQVLISSRGYVTQKKEIEIRPGDVVILNVDLNPKRR